MAKFDEMRSLALQVCRTCGCDFLTRIPYLDCGRCRAANQSERRTS